MTAPITEAAFRNPGFYQALCVNTGYYDFLEALTLEIVDLLGDRLDGLFFDIVGNRSCTCAACRKEMEERGLDFGDAEITRKFGKFVMDRFKNRLSAVIRAKKANCSIFYNAGHIGPYIRQSIDAFSHFELESLPSGWWGYLHFPTTARYARTLGKPCLGMTGKFHTEWGDFHSLKNRAALEFECFRMLSFGFAVSVGDQLEPNGKLNPNTYRLIGDIYKQVEEREEWVKGSYALTEAAIVTPETTDQNVPECIYGAAQMLEELAVQFDIIDAEQEFGKYKLLILPESLRVGERFIERLNEYTAKGGAVLAVADGGMTEKDEYPDCYGITYLGKSEGNDFVVANAVIGKDLPEGNEFVVETEACRFAPKRGTNTIMWAAMPYFYRSGTNFCSHLYTPSSKTNLRPAVSRRGNVVVFSPKIFTHYRKKAPYWCKAMIRDALDLLLGEKKLLRHNGASTIQCSILEQREKNRYLLHILHYIPVRKCTDIDIIEERTTTYGLEVELALPRRIHSARLVPEGVSLEIIGGRKLMIPKINGYQIVELNY